MSKMDFRYYDTELKEWVPSVVDPDLFATQKARIDDIQTRYGESVRHVGNWDGIKQSGTYIGAPNTPNEPAGNGVWLIGEYYKYNDQLGLLKVENMYGNFKIRYYRSFSDGKWDSWVLEKTTFSTIVDQPYETGTFTTSLLNLPATEFQANVGAYVRIGSQITISFEMSLIKMDPNSATINPIVITGLPFYTTKRTGLSVGYAGGLSNGISQSSITAVMLNNEINMYRNGAYFEGSNLTNNTHFIIGGTYSI